MSILSRIHRDFCRNPIVTLAAFTLLAGCASYQPKDNTPTAQDHLRDNLKSCRDYAASTNARADWPLGGVFAGALIGAASGANWFWRGWSGEGAWIGAAAGAGVGFILGLGSSAVEHNKIVDQCMRQRGYRASQRPKA